VFGREGGVAPAVTLFERVQMGAGMRALAAHDHSGPGRVAGQCEQQRPGVRHPRPSPVSSYHDLGTRRCSVHRGSTSPSDRQEPSASTFTRGSEILSSIPTLTRRPAHEEPGINRRSSLRVSPTHTHPRWSRPAAVAEQNLIPIGSWASHSCGHTAQARSVGSAVLGSARRDFSSVIGMFLTFRL
jgi:hypothetical protein